MISRTIDRPHYLLSFHLHNAQEPQHLLCIKRQAMYRTQLSSSVYRSVFGLIYIPKFVHICRTAQDIFDVHVHIPTTGRFSVHPQNKTLLPIPCTQTMWVAEILAIYLYVTLLFLRLLCMRYVWYSRYCKAEDILRALSLYISTYYCKRTLSKLLIACFIL